MRAALATFLAEATGARSAAVKELRLLPNGAVQENWLVASAFEGGTLDGEQRLVLRTNAATSLGAIPLRTSSANCSESSPLGGGAPWANCGGLR